MCAVGPLIYTARAAISAVRAPSDGGFLALAPACAVSAVDLI
jgi:hypothetical protein